MIPDDDPRLNPLEETFPTCVRIGQTEGGPWARPTVDVEPDGWLDALTTTRDELGCDFFDWLTAVDELDEGFTVVAHLWSVTGRFGLLVRTRVPRDRPVLASAVGLFAGAAWAERETHEMFGVDFTDHPGLTPLLLAPEFDGHPLRKEFVLASRVAKPWPGAVEPAAATSPTRPTPTRAPARPPGVPDPAEWGPKSRMD